MANYWAQHLHQGRLVRRVQFGWKKKRLAAQCILGNKDGQVDLVREEGLPSERPIGAPRRLSCSPEAGLGTVIASERRCRCEVGQCDRTRTARQADAYLLGGRLRCPTIWMTQMSQEHTLDAYLIQDVVRTFNDFGAPLYRRIRCRHSVSMTTQACCHFPRHIRRLGWSLVGSARRPF
jgi:hypothetical protein